MNKLLFKLEREFDYNITFIVNNDKDLEDYLKKTYNWYKIEIIGDTVSIKEQEGYATEYASLEWVKHI